MAKLSFCVLLIFSLSFGLYLIGYQSPFLEMQNSSGDTPTTAGGVINNILVAFTTAIGAAVVIGMISGGSSLARSAALITFFGIFLLNFLFLPITLLFDITLPVTVRLFVFGFLQILVIIVALELLTERDL